jgi:molybdenum cofactor biosynthesis enzyme
MKSQIFYSIIILLMMSISLAGCKNKVKVERIPQCAGITGSTMEARTNACVTCCTNNGWENGTYWEIGEVGCECDK